MEKSIEEYIEEYKNSLNSKERKKLKKEEKKREKEYEEYKKINIMMIKDINEYFSTLPDKKRTCVELNNSITGKHIGKVLIEDGIKEPYYELMSFSFISVWGDKYKINT